VWHVVYKPGTAEEAHDLAQLLWGCDLGAKVHAKTGTLSSRQRRKLQVAAGSVAESSSELVHGMR
jgi:ABC-type branched-subunit amino acid transport system ATPase component